MHMDNIRGPVQFFHCLHNSLSKENGAFVIIREQIPVRIGKSGLSFKIFVVIYKVDLYSFLRYGSYLYASR